MSITKSILCVHFVAEVGLVVDVSFAFDIKVGLLVDTVKGRSIGVHAINVVEKIDRLDVNGNNDFRMGRIHVIGIGVVVVVNDVLDYDVRNLGGVHDVKIDVLGVDTIAGEVVNEVFDKVIVINIYKSIILIGKLSNFYNLYINVIRKKVRGNGKEE